MTGRRSTRIRRCLAIVCGVVLVAASCGDDEEGGGASDLDLPEPNCPAQPPDGGDRLAQLQNRGTVTVGIAGEVPYGYQDASGRVTGEAPELARSIFTCLGVANMRAQVVDFSALIAGLQAGQFDMIAAGMFINPERAAQVNFTDPDYCGSQSFAVREGNPLGLTDYESVTASRGKLGVMAGAVEQGQAEVAGIPRDQLSVFIDVNAQYDALDVGRVDAVAGTFATVNRQAEASGGRFEAVEPFLSKDENGDEELGCGAFAFRNDNQELRDAFNEELNRQQDDGTAREIVMAFGFSDEDVDRAEELTVEDLAGP